LSQEEFESIFSQKGSIEIEKMENYSDVEMFEAIISIIQKLVLMGSKSIAIREKAREIIKDVPPHDQWGEVKAVLSWVQNNVRYVFDGFNLEQFQTPVKTLTDLTGDCDCIAILIASLLRSIGHQSGVSLVNAKGRPDVDHAMGCVAFRKDIVLRWGVRTGSGKVEALDKKFIDKIPDELKVPLKIIKGSEQLRNGDTLYNWILLEGTEKKDAGWIPPKITYAVIILPEVVARINVKG
jgi:hypothetical protein